MECALDVVRGGGSFSPEDPDSFWAIMARYASLGKYPSQDGYLVLTPEEMLACAQQVFAGLEALPALPENTTMVYHDSPDATAGTPEQYRLLQGALNTVDVVSMEYHEETGILTVAVRDDGNAYDYSVTLKDGAIVSIESK